MFERLGRVLEESELLHIMNTSKIVRKPKKDGDWGKSVCNFGKNKLSIKFVDYKETRIITTVEVKGD